MNASPAADFAVLYSLDCNDYRKKFCGLRLTDQLLLSLESLRTKFSRSIVVYVIHTGAIPEETRSRIKRWNVKLIQTKGPLHREFPLANKILVGAAYDGSSDILFVDCDTRFYRPVQFSSPADIVVAYDALQALSLTQYSTFFDYLSMSLPSGVIYRRPAYEYYCHGTMDQFPQFNSGVFFLKNASLIPFYEQWKLIFLESYRRFAAEGWSFYLEQLSFIAAILRLRLTYSLLPVGINFICTPRAPDLQFWPRNQIVLEHYAGDTSKPLVFDGNRIAAKASGLI